jgi:hypothetical protein
MHPELKQKVCSQIFDSPCHIDGMAPALREFYGVPKIVTRSLTAILFPDCLKTSEQFMREPVIDGVRTGVIYSQNDVISPLQSIEQMVETWSAGVEMHEMKTKSKHLLHYRDERDRYEALVDDVLQVCSRAQHAACAGRRRRARRRSVTSC